MIVEYYKDMPKAVENSKKRLLDAVASKKLTQSNADLILDFIDNYRPEGIRLKPATVNRHIINLTIIAQKLEKRKFTDTFDDDKLYMKILDDLEDETALEVDGIKKKKKLSEAELKGKKIKKIPKYSQNSLYDFKKGLKVFFKFLNGGEEHPRCIKWVNLTRRPDNNLTDKDMISEEEVLQLIDAVPSLRDKAMTFVLFEGMIRISELLRMRIRDCIPSKNGYTINIHNAKKRKGDESIREACIIGGTRYLRHWLDSHPQKDDQDAHVWITSKGGFYKDKSTGERRVFDEHRVMSDVSVRKILKKAADKVGVTKPINPHNFRRSGATDLMRKGVDSWHISKLGGWTPNSRVLQSYIKTSNKDAHNAIMKAKGIKVDAKGQLTSIKCHSCGEINPPKTSRCACGQPLTPQAIHDEKLGLAKEIAKLMAEKDLLEHQKERESAIKTGKDMPNHVLPLGNINALEGYKAEVNMIPGSGTALFNPQGEMADFIPAEDWVKCEHCGETFHKNEIHPCSNRPSGKITYRQFSSTSSKKNHAD